jgi:hypothetical protein
MNITEENRRYATKKEVQTREEKERWRGGQKGQERKWRTGKEKEENETEETRRGTKGRE